MFPNSSLLDCQCTPIQCVMSAIRRAGGGKGFAEEFFEKEDVTTYTKTKDDKGNEIFVNNDTGELTKVQLRELEIMGQHPEIMYYQLP